MRRLVIWTSLYGLNAGLAASAKQNGVATWIALLAYAGVCGVIGTLHRRRGRWGARGLKEGAHPAQTAPPRGHPMGAHPGRCGGLGPEFFPLSRTCATSDLHEPLSQRGHGGAAEQHRPRPDTFQERVGTVALRTLFPGNFVVLGDWLHLPIDFGLFLLGLGLILCREIQHLREKRQVSPASVLLIWTGVMFAGLVTTIPLDWERYYLPVLPCVALLEGRALASIAA